MLKSGETILLTRKIQSHLSACERYPRVENLELQIQIFASETSEQTDKKT